MRNVKQARLIDSNHPLPFLWIGTNNGSKQHQPGVINKYIQATEMLHHHPNCGLGLYAIGDICRHGQCRASCLNNLLCQVL